MTEKSMTELETIAWTVANKYLAIAEKTWGRKFTLSRIDINLKGRTGGIAISGGSNSRIRLNVEGMREHLDAMIGEIIPHEVAHVVQKQLDFCSQSHGPLWKQVMRVFGLEPNRCHDLPLKPVGGGVEYGCGCETTFWFSRRKHQNVVNGRSRFRCRTCKVILTPVEVKKAAFAPKAPAPVSLKLDRPVTFGTTTKPVVRKGAVAELFELYRTWAREGIEPTHGNFVPRAAALGYVKGTCSRQFYRWMKSEWKNT